MHLLLSARPNAAYDGVTYSLRYWDHEESWLYQEKADYSEDGALPLNGDFGDRWHVLKTVLQEIVQQSRDAQS